MATWVVGDIHGCAAELSLLLGELALGPDDRLLSVGDLFHRGPDAAGVMRLLRGADARFILGNHEHAVLARTGLAPRGHGEEDRPPRRTSFPPLTADDLAGDGRRPLRAADEDLPELLRYLQEHAGFFFDSRQLPGAGPTPDGRDWLVVHASLVPGRHPADCEPARLFTYQRVGRRRRPWFEEYRGPELVLFGHVPNEEPLRREHEGRLVVLGLDTGCVYGGRLTAYCPETGELRSVPAAETYARL